MGRARLTGILAGAAAVALSWGAVASADSEPARPSLTLVADGSAAVATLSAGGAPMPGAAIVFALVGEGRLTGPASCVTPPSGACSVTVEDAGEGALLLARSGALSATLTFGESS